MMSFLKRNKRKLVWVCILAVITLICYLIGQKIVRPNRMKSEGYTDCEGNVPNYSILENFNAWAISGQISSDDYPGGQTIGIITISEDKNVSKEDAGKYIFMSPQTSFAKEFEITSSECYLAFLTGMHPIIKRDVSDGALVVVEIREDNKKILLKEEIEIAPEERLKLVQLDLSRYKGKKITIGISCVTGKSKDEAGDWVVLRYPVISEHKLEYK